MKDPVEILHLEDNSNDAELILESLREAAIPCNVTLVRNRADFLAAVESCRWDLILADYSLPDFDGLAALKHVTEKAPGTTFIFVSGAMGELAVETLKSGATDYVLKHHLERLGPCVRRALLETEEREKRRQAELHYRRLFETAGDGILALDGETGTIVDANPAVESILGCARDETLGKDFSEISPFRDSSTCRDFFGSLQEKEYVYCGDVPLQAQSGARLEVELTGIAYPVDEKRMLCLTIHDITERKQLERVMQRNLELESANIAKDHFLATMSHELRTPLNAIIGFTGVMLMGLSGPLTDKQSKQLETVEASANHLLSLINDMLDLARVESGKGALTIESVLCQSLVEEVRDTLGPLAAGKGLKFGITLPDQQLVFDTDRRALRQILLNLMDNAIKFTEQGEVGMVISRDEANGKSWLQFTVHDTGAGIKPEHQAKLFQAFSRVEPQGPRQREGTGLGLHLSQKLAELLGGRISFNSQYAKGSTFTLSLPEKCNAGGGQARTESRQP
jgi:PAS domain S-box-containing protein